MYDKVQKGETFTLYGSKERSLGASYPKIYGLGGSLGLKRASRRPRKVVEDVAKKGGRGRLEKQN